MTANDVALPEAAASIVIADVARFGTEDVETGGFLLAPRDNDTISVVALAGTAGIRRHRKLLQMSDLALDRLFGYADEHDLWIPVQFHSHEQAAFMSPTDIDHGFSVEGFVTTIIPRFSAPPADPSQWGWWRYDSGWTPATPPRGTTDTASAVIFDEDGIRGG
jgi:hypothetical protein